MFFFSDLRSRLTDELKKNGIRFRYETEIRQVNRIDQDSFRVQFNNNDDSLETNLVMYAIGRKPAIKNLGIDQVGIRTNSQDVILVNDFSQTNVPNIFAVNFHKTRQQIK